MTPILSHLATLSRLVRVRTLTAGAAIGLVAAAALPAAAAGPHRDGTYGGGLLDGNISNVITLRAAEDAGSVNIRARITMRCADEPFIAEFLAVKVDKAGKFHGRTQDASIQGTFDGQTAGGTLAATAGGCKQAKAKWKAGDPAAPRTTRGGAKKNATYYGTNDTVQDLFDAKGARGPFMLRVSKNGRAVVQAFMRAEWSCKEGAATGESFFDDQDLARKFAISKKGGFGRTFSTTATRDDGTVTVFRTTFKGRFSGGGVKGTWREITEHKATVQSTSVLGGCDSGNVRFAGVPG
jgi:hypothetical protein